MTFKTLSVYLCARSSISIQLPEVGRKYERKIKQVSNVSFVEGVNMEGSSTGWSYGQMRLCSWSWTLDGDL